MTPDPSRLHRFPEGLIPASAAVDVLSDDGVVLFTGLSAAGADEAMLAITERLGRRESLEVQAGFAAVQGHRTTISEAFMSVNGRTDYQFISPHSEGGRSSAMQIAAFYCRQNTTDGGHTILFNVDSCKPGWTRLREVQRKIDIGEQVLSASQLAMLRMRHQICWPDAELTAEDEILGEMNSPIQGTRILEVLSPIRAVYSEILHVNVNVYWDPVASSDGDNAVEYRKMLIDLALLRQPEEMLPLAAMDCAHHRRIYNSGVRFSELFRSYVELKLEAGQLILFNNLTWAHSASNWTPGSGVRDVVAAFA